MIFPLLLAAQLSSGQLPPAQPFPPPSFDNANVLAPIERLFDAFEAGDSAAMLRLVYPDGRVTATGNRASGSGLRQQSWAEFAQRVNPEGRFTETISNPAIEVDGDIAMVWAPFVVRGQGHELRLRPFRPGPREWRVEDHEPDVFFADLGLPDGMIRRA